MQYLDLFYTAGIIVNLLLFFLCLILILKHTSKSVPCRLLMVTALFTGLDYVWLIMLNWLKQSYGPPLLTWLVWAAARTALLFAWLFINRINQTIFQIKAVSWKVWLTANLFLFLLGGYAFYVEPFLLMDTFHEIKTQNIQSGARFRVVQVSDIHVERMTRREYALIRHVNNLKPDIVVVTGDYPNLSFINDVDTWDQITYIINHFEAPYGVYLINGSNETPERVRKLAKDSHAIALTDQVFHVNWQGGNVVLMGVNDIHFHQPPVDNFRVLSKEVNEDEFVILLHHTPDLAEAAYDQKVDLYLAGHTHGGQIRVPFYGAVFTSSIFAKKYEMGTYLLKNMTLYVNRGVGMEGLDAPRARFLAPPEVVVFDLLGTGQ